MTDIVERLFSPAVYIARLAEENERLRAALEQIRDAGPMTLDERLAEENERLRAALREVIECDPGAYEATIARAALEVKND